MGELYSERGNMANLSQGSVAIFHAERVHMCGRFVAGWTPEDIARTMDAALFTVAASGPSWNVAPSQTIATLAARADGDGIVRRALIDTTWGFQPSWAAAKKVRPMINARSETIAEKRMFSHAVKNRRVVIPADGWFEWQATAGKKTPHYMTSGDVLYFAGIAVPGAQQDDGEQPLTSAIITMAAPEHLADIHDRAPAALPASLIDDWLDPGECSADAVTEMLACATVAHAEPREVGSAVGNVRTNHPGLIDPIPEQDSLF